jgi:hypothetical protein
MDTGKVCGIYVYSHRLNTLIFKVMYFEYTEIIAIPKCKFISNCHYVYDLVNCSVLFLGNVP